MKSILTAKQLSSILVVCQALLMGVILLTSSLTSATTHFAYAKEKTSDKSSTGDSGSGTGSSSGTSSDSGSSGGTSGSGGTGTEGTGGSSQGGTGPKGSTAHCDRPGYPSCSSLGSAAGSSSPGTSCPPGHSKAFCKAYNSAAGSSTSAPTPQPNTAHCDVPGYPSCYSLGYADGKAHPGTSCPSGHSANYCAGYRAGAGSPAPTSNTTASLQSDVAHCNLPNWPSCYSVGYQDGKLHPGAPCPTGHSADFCSGWNAGAGNTAHCDQKGWPSCYSIGLADGRAHPGTTCPSRHTQNYCAGWNAGAGNTAHCDQKGWPSCYDMGYADGKAHPGTVCPPGHSKAYCNGYATGAGNTPMVDTHCDTSGYPSCYSLGYQAGRNAAPGTPCPSGHSLNYCSGWQAGNTGSGPPPKCTISTKDASYKTAQNTPIDITLIAQDNGQCVKPITIRVVSEPKHGDLKPTGTNLYAYTPNTGFNGTDTFQYQASDNNGTKSKVGAISITVSTGPTGTLRILSHTWHVDNVGVLHVVGEVENDSPNTAKFVEVVATFYDANKNVVGTASGFTDPYNLSPGSRAPFDLLLSSASIPISQIFSTGSYSLQLNPQ